MKNILTSLTILLFLTISCNEKPTGEQILSHDIYSFSIPVTCVKQSRFNDSIIFVGLENGSIVKKNIYSNEQVPVNVGDNYIYEIFELNDANDLLVGIRDQGLKLVHCDNPKKNDIEFEIVNKTTNYGVYSIAFDSIRNLFVFGTSNGCFFLKADMIYKAKELQPVKQSFISTANYGFNKILLINEKIYMASKQGLFVADIIADNTGNEQDIDNKGYIIDTCNIDTVINNKEIIDIFYQDTILHACVNNEIYRMNIKNDSILSHTACNSKLYAGIRDALGGQWLLCNDKIIYESGTKSMEYKFIGSANIFGKQLVAANKYFVFVAHDNKIIRFSNHQNLDGDKNSVLTLCKDTENDDVVYFLTADNKLHKYTVNEKKESLETGAIKNLNINKNNIIGSCFAKDNKKNIMYVATDNCIYTINIDANELENSVTIDKGNDIRCIFYYDNDKKLYVGTRFNLQKLNNNTLSIDTALKPYDDLYVTSLCQWGVDLAVGTLNKGAYRILSKRNNNIDTLISDNRYGNIRNVIRGNDLYIQTSTGLYKHKDKNVLDTLSNIKINKNRIKSVYRSSHATIIIGYQGFAYIDDIEQSNKIRKNIVDNFIFNDIKITNNNVAYIGGLRFIIGNNFGLFEYDNINKKLSPVAIKNNPKTDIDYKILVVLVFITGGLIYHFKIINGKSRRMRRNLNKRADNMLHTVKTEIKREKINQELIQKLDKIEKILHKKPVSDKINDTVSKNMDEIENEIRTEKLFNKLNDRIENMLNSIKTDMIPGKISQELEQKLEEIKKRLDSEPVNDKIFETEDKNLKEIKITIDDAIKQSKKIENLFNKVNDRLENIKELAEVGLIKQEDISPFFDILDEARNKPMEEINDILKNLNSDIKVISQKQELITYANERKTRYNEIIKEKIEVLEKTKFNSGLEKTQKIDLINKMKEYVDKEYKIYEMQNNKEQFDDLLKDMDELIKKKFTFTDAEIDKSIENLKNKYHKKNIEEIEKECDSFFDKYRSAFPLEPVPHFQKGTSILYIVTLFYIDGIKPYDVTEIVNKITKNRPQYNNNRIGKIKYNIYKNLDNNKALVENNYLLKKLFESIKPSKKKTN
ncbi:MAG: hypothetical protein LBS69_07095 [Prevotellaceae bacterium]|jgi:hypothetical protein|nr:hypothetical protein [Prevotellaceae bacterium]